jgi:hypothetical protein
MQHRIWHMFYTVVVRYHYSDLMKLIFNDKCRMAQKSVNWFVKCTLKYIRNLSLTKFTKKM